MTVSLSGRSELGEFAALVVRTDFTDEAAWRELIEGLEVSATDDNPADSCRVLNAPELHGASTDKILSSLMRAVEVRNRISVISVADSIMSAKEHHALLAVATATREVLGNSFYESMVEFGREFRTVPAGVHEINTNLALANMDFEEFASFAGQDPEGVFRSFDAIVEY
jgi:hypothetical protein